MLVAGTKPPTPETVHDLGNERFIVHRRVD